MMRVERWREMEGGQIYSAATWTALRESKVPIACCVAVIVIARAGHTRH
jgi:hypothetical protein